MVWSNGYRMRLVVVGIVASMVIGGRSARADFIFGEPVNLGPTINTSSLDGFGCFSSDGLEMYLDSNRPGGSGGGDIWVTTRPTISDPWDAPVNLGPPVNSSAWEEGPNLSADGLELYFHSNRSGGQGRVDIWVARRATTQDPWGEPVNLGQPVNSGNGDHFPSISTDGLSLFFDCGRSGGQGHRDVWVTTRPTLSDPWDAPVNLGPPVNSSYREQTPTISVDGLVLLFSCASERPPGGVGGSDLWMTTRPTVSELWAEAVNLGPIVNSSDSDAGADISHDGSSLYFCSNRPGGHGGWDLWQAPIILIVDFNGDGIVDSADMCMMVDHWGEYYPLCDIGPMPWGDGIVDVQDLIVLSEHLFEEVNDPTLVAHWPLDETEGDIAYDSIGDYDGTLMGDPVWQPDGGVVAGALQLDGIDDCVSTDFVLNPAAGPFSVIVWIKGGAPGQVLLSQAGGANWLCTDSVEGNLMTELIGFGRSADVLLSQTSITDGNWHRIGFVWDGSHRYLYIDGVQVAEDASHFSGLQVVPGGGLYLGSGSALAPGSFFSGLIDDVRIYNRVVNP